MCHQVFLRSAAKKHVSITNRLPPLRYQAIVTLAGLQPGYTPGNNCRWQLFPWPDFEQPLEKKVNPM
jgi:hypothetical protein